MVGVLLAVEKSYYILDSLGRGLAFGWVGEGGWGWDECGWVVWRGCCCAVARARAAKQGLFNY
eukprot:scaffold29160_cov24-Tisochrysis_lutea.AAC.1